MENAIETQKISQSNEWSWKDENWRKYLILGVIIGQLSLILYGYLILR